MATDSEWFEGRQADDGAGDSILPMPLWFALIAVVMVLLAGCATHAPTEPETHICFMKLLGHTEQGYSVVTQQCMTPEAFAESQK